jgi:hypothetical protein
MERDEYERKRLHELEQQRIEASRRESDVQARRDLEKEEARLRLEREKMELEARREEMRQERERMRAEAEERRQREKLEFERKMQLEREERERRERADRERWERERAEQERKRDEERREWERREQMRREEMTREADRRREEMTVQMKQMEMNAQRDREHAERMSEQARMERESQREAAERREKMEREQREFQEKERDRQMQLQREEMRLQKERDREHAERMIQLQKVQSSGLGGLTDMLGMETPELLGRIFGGGDDADDGGWADAIPKVLGGIGELGKAIMAGQQGGPGMAPQGRTPRQDAQQKIAIQTPQGVKMITVDQLRELQERQAQQRAALPAPAELPNQSFVPGTPQPAAKEAPPPPVLVPEEPEPELSEDFQAALEVNTSQRAKAAGINLKGMKNARKALRGLAKRLGRAEESEWEELVTAALMMEPSILPYVTAVSAYAAFVETKADPELIEKVIAMLKASPLVPDGAVPYNEADLAALQAPPAAEQEAAPAEAQPELPAGVHAAAPPAAEPEGEQP